MAPEYLKDVQATAGAVNFGNRSLELTRRSRALKLWMSIRTYGAKRFREAIQRGIDLAKFAGAELHSQPERWEIVTPATIGVICFALQDWHPGIHLRLCMINPLTTEEDIRETIRRLCGA
jgi:glutamate/tyrosine decarboxylase-like PLP-dependent enzyme